ncbi:MAG: outer membrane protein OmpA-like peptidoglycan-associated protein [Cyclobacteriaceae bacterium]|jgi:outer membrane protein OmpA-like peptidoglycan-associated protein
MKLVSLLFFMGCLLIKPALSQAQDSEPSNYYLQSIYFAGGSYYITEDQQKEVRDFIGSVKQIENYQISVHGYTDNIGSKAYNQWLSAMRTQESIELLERFNIERSLIEIKQFGFYNPIYDNNSYLGRLKNRRVDIILWPIAL